MITKLAKSVTAPIVATAVAYQHLKDITPEQRLLVNRKLHRNPNANLAFYTLSNSVKGANKLSNLADVVANDINVKDERAKKAFKYGVKPLAELIGAYLATKKIRSILKKEAGVLDMAQTYGTPIYDVASGQSSLGETAGRIAGGALVGGGVYKALDPLIRRMPHGYLRGAARVGQFVGSMIGGGYASNKLGNIGKKFPLYKRPGYDRIQHFNETGEIT